LTPLVKNITHECDAEFPRSTFCSVSAWKHTSASILSVSAVHRITHHRLSAVGGHAAIRVAILDDMIWAKR